MNVIQPRQVERFIFSRESWGHYERDLVALCEMEKRRARGRVVTFRVKHGDLMDSFSEKASVRLTRVERILSMRSVCAAVV